MITQPTIPGWYLAENEHGPFVVEVERGYLGTLRVVTTGDDRSYPIEDLEAEFDGAVWLAELDLDAIVDFVDRRDRHNCHNCAHCEIVRSEPTLIKTIKDNGEKVELCDAESRRWGVCCQMVEINRSEKSQSNGVGYAPAQLAGAGGHQTNRGGESGVTNADLPARGAPSGQAVAGGQTPTGGPDQDEQTRLGGGTPIGVVDAPVPYSVPTTESGGVSK